VFPWLKSDLVMNTALLIKALQIRQEGGLRELHRFGRWPRRSSHGRDLFGISTMHSRARTSTEIDNNLSVCNRFAVSFLLIVLRETQREVSKKD
jgi:hypothetical protein